MKFLILVVLVTTATISFGQKKDADKEVQNILKKYTCTKCHTRSMRLVGPSYTAIAKRGYSKEQLVELIIHPKPSNWPGYAAMPTIDTLRRIDLLKVADWIVTLNND